MGSTTGAMTPRASALFNMRRPIVARNGTPSAQDEGPCCKACALGDFRPATKGTSWHRRTPQGVGRSLHRPAPPTSATWCWSAIRGGQDHAGRGAAGRHRDHPAGRPGRGRAPRSATSTRSRSGSSARSTSPWRRSCTTGSRSTCSTRPGTPTSSATCGPGLRAADAALFVVSAADGVDGLTRMLWEECAAVGMPRAVVITKLDHQRADFDEALAACQDAFGEARRAAVPAGAATTATSAG